MPEPLPALQIAPAGGGGSAFSPLDTLSKFATIQNSLNQNRLFQQTFAARQMAGQIIASAPDLDTGLANLFKHPDVAPFAGEFANTVRTMQSTMADIATKKQALTQSGLSYTLHGLSSALGDPSTLESSLRAGLSTVDPMAAPGVTSAVGSIVQSLGHGLPSDPAAARALYSARLVGTLLSAGHTPETIRAITGTLPPGVEFAPVGAGGAQVPVVRGGPAAGGGANIPMQIGGGAPTGGNALSPASPTVASPALAGPSQEQTKASEGAGAAAGDISSQMTSHAQMLPAAINRIDMMTGAMGSFQAGGGADFRAQLAKGLQALQHMGLPISSESIDKVGNSDLAATQIFNSQVKPYAVGVLKEVAQGTGRVMRSEVDAFLNALDATTDPKAIIEIMNSAKRVLHIGYDQGARFTDFRQMLARGDPSVKGLGPSDFFTWYNRNPQPLQTPPAMDLGPTPFSAIRGAAPAKEWIVRGGKLVPAEARP